MRDHLNFSFPTFDMLHVYVYDTRLHILHHKKFAWYKVPIDDLNEFRFGIIRCFCQNNGMFPFGCAIIEIGFSYPAHSSTTLTWMRYMR